MSTLQETFTLALQGIVTSTNYRDTNFSSNYGLPVNSNLQTTTYTIPVGSSLALKASQMIVIISNQPVRITVVPDVTTDVTSPGNATIDSGYVFVFSGSFTTSGITVLNPSSASTPALVRAVLVS